jgi:hypothetical protein
MRILLAWTQDYTFSMSSADFAVKNTIAQRNDAATEKRQDAKSLTAKNI